MAYEELKRDYNKYKKVPSDAKLVSRPPRRPRAARQRAHRFKITEANKAHHFFLPFFFYPARLSSLSLVVVLCKQSSLEYITMAAVSKIFAVATTYPYQVVRARLQDQHNTYKGVLDVITRTWR